MRVHTFRISAVLVAALVVAMAVPAAAFGAGTVSGDFKEFGPLTPIPRGFVGLYELTAAGGVVKVDSDNTDAAGGYGPLTAADAHTGQYLIRAGRPGYDSAEGGPNPVIGGVNLDWLLAKDPMLVERTWGNDRYSTAVNVARERFTTPMTPQGWWGVDTVVIASGEDRAAADPLAAASLCGAYGDTPLLLVSSTMVPSSVKTALTEISNTRKDVVRVVIVGGPVSVPEARLTEIASAMPHGVVLDRLLTSGDRFDLAAAIAERTQVVSGVTGAAFVANGADPDKFFDALALSTAAAAKRFPILLVSEDSIPSATQNALGQMGTPNIFIGGGPATVSPQVMAQLDHDNGPGTVERWAGSDRYRTAQAIADGAMSEFMLSDDLVGVASKLPDALTGGATLGQTHGILLITNGESLTSSTGNWLEAHKAEIDKSYVIGGPVSMTPAVKTQIEGKLQ